MPKRQKCCGCFPNISAEKKKNCVSSKGHSYRVISGVPLLCPRATVSRTASLVPLLRKLSVTTSKRNSKKKPKGHAGLPRSLFLSLKGHPCFISKSTASFLPPCSVCIAPASGFLTPVPARKSTGQTPEAPAPPSALAEQRELRLASHRAALRTEPLQRSCSFSALPACLEDGERSPSDPGTIKSF